MENIVSLQSALLVAVGAAFFGIVSLAVSLVLILCFGRLRRRLAAFLAGKDGQDLEALIETHGRRLDRQEDDIRQLYEAAEELYLLGNESLHRTEVLRFNPFKEVGGNQSFVVALLNGRNTGFVLSSLHTREGTRIYAKPVITGAATPEHPFSKEEQETVARAGKKRPPKRGENRRERKNKT